MSRLKETTLADGRRVIAGFKTVNGMRNVATFCDTPLAVFEFYSPSFKTVNGMRNVATKCEKCGKAVTAKVAGFKTVNGMRNVATKRQQLANYLVDFGAKFQNRKRYEKCRDNSVAQLVGYDANGNEFQNRKRYEKCRDP